MERTVPALLVKPPRRPCCRGPMRMVTGVLDWLPAPPGYRTANMPPSALGTKTVQFRTTTSSKHNHPATWATDCRLGDQTAASAAERDTGEREGHTGQICGHGTRGGPHVRVDSRYANQGTSMICRRTNPAQCPLHRTQIGIGRIKAAATVPSSPSKKEVATPACGAANPSLNTPHTGNLWRFHHQSNTDFDRLRYCQRLVDLA